MIRAHRETPCWELVNPTSGRPPAYESGDGWPHYRTEAEAVADVDDEYDPPLKAQLSFGGACLGVFCDGPRCEHPGEPLDANGEGWTHLDPSDPTPFDIEDMDWLEVDGKHYCDGCTPPWCEDCDERHAEDDTCPSQSWRPVPVSDGQLALADVEAPRAEEGTG